MHLRKQIPHLAERLFLRLLGQMSAEIKVFKEYYGKEETRRILEYPLLQRVVVG